MKIKEIILVFLLGIILGICPSFLIKIRSRKIFLSPNASFTLAESRNLDKKNHIKKQVSSNKVKGSQFSLLISESPLPQAFPKISKYQGLITIAAFGDSMIDRMQTNLPYLEAALKKYYPEAKFNLLNYGIASENIEQGVSRVQQEYNYKERHYSPLTILKPDVIILGSFSYNPFAESEDELYRHWANLSSLMNILKEQTSAKIIILATIAPNKENFGRGPKGVNWPPDRAWLHASKIENYLKNTVIFAKSRSLPLVDVFHASLNKNDGNLAYIDPKDHIHQNEAGNKLIAQLLAEKIYHLNLF